MLSVGFRSEASCIKYRILHLAKPRLRMTKENVTKDKR